MGGLDGCLVWLILIPTGLLSRSYSTRIGNGCPSLLPKIGDGKSMVEFLGPGDGRGYFIPSLLKTILVNHGWRLHRTQLSGLRLFPPFYNLLLLLYTILKLVQSILPLNSSCLVLFMGSMQHKMI